MPELPEVETTRRGIEAALTGVRLAGAVVRDGRLRWPVPADLDALVAGRRVERVWRRAKYLLIDLGHGHLILHLGMSGSLRVLRAERAPLKHDHVDLLMTDRDHLLRFHDPRRFGAILWQPGELFTHPLLASLGPEPLESGFSAAYLKSALGKRQIAIKLALMNNQIVVGVGNIYANEALFRAGIRPDRPAARLSQADCERLVNAVRETLTEAIAAGGSTLRDFVDSDGRSGYFQQQYFVYGREGQACRQCGGLIRQSRLGQRATFWCEHCQSS